MTPKTHTTQNIKNIMAQCPQCKESTNVNTNNPHRPFCSERCKLIDLGNWASGSYAISSSEKDNSDEDEFE